MAGNRETRISSTASLRVERRASGESTTPFIVGHASVFDQWATIYEGRYFTWREVVRPGAYSRAIAEKQDVRALFNHDANFVLGRTRSGTLTLREDSAGLMTETSAPETPTIRDLVLAPIEREDITGMSFAFSVRIAEKIVTTENEDGSTVIDRGGDRITRRWEGERLIEERELLDCDLFDISAVTYPAYEQTDVSLRSVLGIDTHILEMDRPHKRSAPKREELRRWLAQSATLASASR